MLDLTGVVLYALLVRRDDCRHPVERSITGKAGRGRNPAGGR